MKQGTTIIRTALGDITTIAGMDAIVNAANKNLSVGTGGVNYAIHKAAGPGLADACKKLNGCDVGKAKITSAYSLPCSYIIHTVGPVWVGGHNNEAESLKSCYKSCLEIAYQKKLRRVAFPSISTGLHYLPLKLAADTAINSVGEYITAHPNAFDEIVWVLFEQNTKSHYDAALAAWEIAFNSKKSAAEKQNDKNAATNPPSSEEKNSPSIPNNSLAVPVKSKALSWESIELHCLSDLRLLRKKEVKKVKLKGAIVPFPILKCPGCNRHYTNVSTSKDTAKIKLGDTVYTNLLAENDKERLQSFLEEPHTPDDTYRFYAYKDKPHICPSCKTGPFQKRKLLFTNAKSGKQMHIVCKYCQYCNRYYMHYSSFSHIKESLNIINSDEYSSYLEEDKGKESPKIPTTNKVLSVPKGTSVKHTPTVDTINVRDFVVRRTAFKCIHSHHKLQDIAGSIDVVNAKGDIINLKITAGYCPDCKVFFILESTYDYLRHKGIPLCRISSEEAYEKGKVSTSGMKLAAESILMQHGYTVSQQEGLTDAQRQRILAVLIDNKIMTKASIISYLDFFISQKKNNHMYEKAISKWQDDREFVNEYKIGTHKKYAIKGIHVKH